MELPRKAWLVELVEDDRATILRVLFIGIERGLRNPTFLALLRLADVRKVLASPLIEPDEPK